MREKEVVTRKTITVEDCDVCGKEYEIGDFYKDSICYDCKTQQAVNKALDEAGFLLNATIISINLVEQGVYASADDIESINIQTRDGKRFNLSVEGYDEHCIGWEAIYD